MMLRTSLVLVVVLVVAYTEGAILKKHSRRGDSTPETPISYERRNYCRNLVHPADQCPVEEWPQLAPIFGPTDSTPREQLESVREAGWASLCNQVDELFDCSEDIVANGLRECDDVLGKTFREEKVVEVVESAHSFQQEICEPEFGDFEASLNCFTNYDLIESAAYCVFGIKNSQAGLDTTSFITCVQAEMEEFPDDCDEDSQQLFAKTVRAAAQTASPYLKGVRLPRNLRKLVKYF